MKLHYSKLILFFLSSPLSVLATNYNFDIGKDYGIKNQISQARNSSDYAVVCPNRHSFGIIDLKNGKLVTVHSMEGDKTALVLFKKEKNEQYRVDLTQQNKVFLKMTLLFKNNRNNIQIISEDYNTGKKDNKTCKVHKI